ncbi:MAG: DNA translocase FtsK, partial [Spirochaetota bacterium]
LHPHILADEDDNKITEEKAAIILKTLKDFGIESKLLNYIKGPVVTRFELEIDEKVNLGKIINLEKNITYNLSAEKIRILAPIPGKKAVGIEIPNEIKQIVYFTDLAKSDEFKNSNINLPFILGKDIEGKTIVTDISKSPHLLIAGRTGSGKSVCINTLIASLVIANPPERVRLLLIDPKRVELSLYNDLPHLLTDEIIIYPEDASAALKWLVAEMENRYSILKEHSVRSIEDYNQIMEEKLPYLVLIIDEFYALMQTAQKIIEDSLIHLSAMARAVGIHLIFATQRPSAEVVTGVIKSNLPSRIAFQTFSKTDSRIILDTSGAESLLGNGDMLFSFAGLPPVRIQGAFISTNEVRELVKKISEKYKTERKAINELFSEIKIEENGYNPDESFIDDPLYPQAVEIVKRERKVSASYLQRRLKIGYNRAARIVEKMEEDGLISSLIDGKKREIYI